MITWGREVDMPLIYIHEGTKEIDIIEYIGFMHISEITHVKGYGYGQITQS